MKYRMFALMFFGAMAAAFALGMAAAQRQSTPALRVVRPAGVRPPEEVIEARNAQIREIIKTHFDAAKANAAKREQAWSQRRGVVIDVNR